MTAQTPRRDTEPRLRDTLRDDIQQGNYLRTFRKELHELKAFYISDVKHKRLQSMTPLKRGLYIAGWLGKGMLLKLTPFRRIVLVAGLVLLITSPVVVISEERVQITNLHLVGGAAILLVLMLELKDKLLARDELVAGQRVQRALLPEQTPSVPGWKVWIYSRPANEVGGDLIDFIKLGGNRFAIALGDVSGKGLQAALIMAKLQATLKALAPDFRSLAELVEKLNVIFYRDGLPNSFASLVFAEITSDSGSLRFVNAGHYPPILITAGEPKEMQKGDAALGLMASVKYQELQVGLGSGETFIIYSDGLTEARNERDEFFGVERLLTRLSSLKDRSPEEMGNALLGEVNFFARDASPNDDLSLVILRRE